MAERIGWIAARDLGDGHLEPWEQNPDRTIPLWQDRDACRADLIRHRVDLETWRVLAVVDQDEEPTDA